MVQAAHWPPHRLARRNMNVLDYQCMGVYLVITCSLWHAFHSVYCGNHCEDRDVSCDPNFVADAVLRRTTIYRNIRNTIGNNNMLTTTKLAVGVFDQVVIETAGAGAIAPRTAAQSCFN
jgi:hypothetical protein